MHSYRSMIFAGLALIACALAITPTAASAPIDPGINAPLSVLHDHQAPVGVDIAELALTCEARDMPAPVALRSSFSSGHMTVASRSLTSGAVRFIELRRRC
ncbi:hypothetical protein GOA89_11485 [Sinorhizobium meliloti]|nr:hypothetical protein [Sinorhizobium meliloti]MDW9846924.1 hypothetical protein [Sinorhizobium meliloti]MDX0143728.1 hypothetical protein [Sinorhizobium meliloti]MDX0149753.1 hypothetical protein [Sinorhizobium meliloti]MDX0168972.1 hypothetical protein [Sinorhizobium meliloti]